MNNVSIHLDLDETLIHSGLKRMIMHDLRLLFHDGHGRDIRDLRLRFDRLVANRIPLDDRDPTQRYARMREIEVEVAEELLIERGWVPFPDPDPELGKRMLRIRPDLSTFLDRLASFGPLYLCTSAGSTYARACLRTARVLDKFEAIHSAEDMADDAFSLNKAAPLLLDNLPKEDVWIVRKLRFLGVSIPADYEVAFFSTIALEKKVLIWITG